MNFFIKTVFSRPHSRSFRPYIREKERFRSLGTGVSEKDRFCSSRPFIQEEKRYRSFGTGVSDDDRFRASRPSIREEERFRPVRSGVAEDDRFRSFRNSTREKERFRPVRTGVSDDDRFRSPRSSIRKKEKFRPVQTGVLKKERFRSSRLEPSSEFVMHHGGLHNHRDKYKTRSDHKSKQSSGGTPERRPRSTRRIHDYLTSSSHELLSSKVASQHDSASSIAVYKSRMMKIKNLKCLQYKDVRSIERPETSTTRQKIKSSRFKSHKSVATKSLPVSYKTCEGYVADDDVKIDILSKSSQRRVRSYSNSLAPCTLNDLKKLFTVGDSSNHANAEPSLLSSRSSMRRRSYSGELFPRSPSRGGRSQSVTGEIKPAKKQVETEILQTSPTDISVHLSSFLASNEGTKPKKTRLRHRSAPPEIINSSTTISASGSANKNLRSKSLSAISTPNKSLSRDLLGVFAQGKNLLLKSKATTDIATLKFNFNKIGSTDERPKVNTIATLAGAMQSWPSTFVLSDNVSSLSHKHGLFTFTRRRESSSLFGVSHVIKRRRRFSTGSNRSKTFINHRKRKLISSSESLRIENKPQSQSSINQTSLRSEWNKHERCRSVPADVQSSSLFSGVSVDKKKPPNNVFSGLPLTHGTDDVVCVLYLKLITVQTTNSCLTNSAVFCSLQDRSRPKKRKQSPPASLRRKHTKRCQEFVLGELLDLVEKNWFTEGNF